MTAHPSISLITITRNEEALIGQCLRSAWFCDEKIVIDSLSADRTVEIARAAGASVVEHEFTNYVMQKQMALDRATGEWVLLMDADEQATHDLGEEILTAVSSPDAADGYRVRRILYHLGHYYSHSIYPDRPVRLFRRARGFSWRWRSGFSYGFFFTCCGGFCCRSGDTLIRSSREPPYPPSTSP